MNDPAGERIHASATWHELQRVREADEEYNAESPESDEERGGWVHGDDVGADFVAECEVSNLYVSGRSRVSEAEPAMERKMRQRC